MNGPQVVAVGSAMAHNLLLLAGLPPSETLGKCGKCKIFQLLFGGSEKYPYIWRVKQKHPKQNEAYHQAQAADHLPP